MIKKLLSSNDIEYLNQFSQLWIGFSGGLDSMVLLHVLAQEPELQSKMTAMHIHHGLSPHASQWQKHCEAVCQSFNLPFISQAVTINEQANVEESARKARYAVFASHIEENEALLLGHHRDDQAETLLLQLFRGAGIDGLAAMEPVRNFARGIVIRPFLNHSRADLLNYAQEKQLQWIEDESNNNQNFSRNFLRHEIIPLLQTRWPALSTNLARTAAHCLTVKKQLDELAEMDYPGLAETSTLELAHLVPSDRVGADRIKNVLRSWLKKNKVLLPDTPTLNRLVSELILSRKDADPIVQWGEYCVRRFKQLLYLLRIDDSFCAEIINWCDFPQPLWVKSLGVRLAITSAAQGLVVPLQGKIELRFRQGGERFVWHGQTKALKKLLQEWSIPTWLRDRIPLIYIDDQLAVVVGYAVSDDFYGKENAVEIVLSSAQP